MPSENPSAKRETLNLSIKPEVRDLIDRTRLGASEEPHRFHP
jgi:hypothetical protein